MIIITYGIEFLLCDLLIMLSLERLERLERLECKL
jgi:hypothetical protein